MRFAPYELSSAARADALFASALQRSDVPTTRQVEQAISAAIRAFGDVGCAARVAQEYGEHPETAVARMRWARAVASACGGPGPEPAARARGGPGPEPASAYGASGPGSARCGPAPRSRRFLGRRDRVTTISWRDGPGDGGLWPSRPGDEQAVAFTAR